MTQERAEEQTGWGSASSRFDHHLANRTPEPPPEPQPGHGTLCDADRREFLARQRKQALAEGKQHGTDVPDAATAPKEPPALTNEQLARLTHAEYCAHRARELEYEAWRLGSMVC